MSAEVSLFGPRYATGTLPRYGVAVALGALGLAIGLLVPTVGSFQMPLVAGYTVLILASAVFGGLRPGILCTLLCAAGVVYWAEPAGAFAIHAPAEIVGVVFFVGTGVTVSIISERMHDALWFERRARLLAEQMTRSELTAREADHAAQRSREELLALVAHDLQDTLGVIDLNVGLIEKVTAADQQVQRRTAIVHRTVHRMSRLIHDLLQSSALAVGKLSLDLGAASVGQLLAETVEEHEPQAQQRSVQLDHESPVDLPPVRCDRDRVLQVLSNLVSNAVRFTPAGGRVLLRARAGGDVVRVSVSDTGRGISARLVPLIFDPYSRERRENGGRTGLGLSIAKAVIEQHGGTIGVESQEGAGTTFTFTLPVATGLVPIAESNQAHRTAPGASGA
jgi:signal transduction histidine kinase